MSLVFIVGRRDVVTRNTDCVLKLNNSLMNCHQLYLGKYQQKTDDIQRKVIVFELKFLSALIKCPEVEVLSVAHKMIQTNKQTKIF